MHRCRCTEARHARSEKGCFAEATLFLGEEFLRISEDESATGAVNTYYDRKMAASVRTCSEREEEPKQWKKV